jgi:hypothetical protein
VKALTRKDDEVAEGQESDNNKGYDKHEEEGFACLLVLPVEELARLLDEI